LDFFKNEDVDLCISIDGPAHVHDINRCYKDGHGSFAEVARNLREAIKHLDYVQVNAVYSPETIDFLVESVSFLSQLGVPVIHLNPDICASWAKDTHPKLREMYMDVANYYIQGGTGTGLTNWTYYDVDADVILQRGETCHDKPE